MNQNLYVELPHIKNEKLYKLNVPYGVQWKEVREVMLEMVVELSKEIDAFDRQEKARLEAAKLEADKLEAEKAAAVPVESSKPEETNPSAVTDAEIIPD